MAASDKNIVISPQRGSAALSPTITFTGDGNDPITLYTPDGAVGSLSFEGSAGQLFSITNNLTSGSIFSVNDVSGIPSLDIDASGLVQIAPLGGIVALGQTTVTAGNVLDVKGNVRIDGDLSITSTTLITNLNADLLDGIEASGFIQSSSTQTSDLYIRNTSPTIYLRDTDHRSSMIHQNSNLFYVLRGDGNDSVTWAQTGGQWPLVIDLENNDATFGRNISAVGDISSSSDIKLKTNIKTLSNSLEKVLSLRGVEYNRIDLEGQPRHIGLIAQEVEEVIPELVGVSKKFDPENGELLDEHKTVSYGNITALLIEAIKEQQKQIEALCQEISDLRSGLK